MPEKKENKSKLDKNDKNEKKFTHLPECPYCNNEVEYSTDDLYHLYFCSFCCIYYEKGEIEIERKLMKGDSVDISEEDKIVKIYDLDEIEDNAEYEKLFPLNNPKVKNKLRINDFQISISTLAYQQIINWYNSTKVEFQAIGNVLKIDNEFLIDKFYLLKGEGEHASNETQEGFGLLIEELIKDNREDEIETLKVFCHSHPNMSCFWSSDDNQAIDTLLHDNNYLISLVVGKDHDIRVRLDVKSIISYTLDNIPLYYSIPLNSEYSVQDAKQEVKDKIKESFNTGFKWNRSRKWDHKTNKWVEIEDNKDNSEYEENRRKALNAYHFGYGANDDENWYL